MADFSYLSDTDDSAVEEVISQTKDLCLLEQISALNCSSFTDSVLPTHLESRFRKLKSFPIDHPKSSSVSSKKQSSASASTSDLRDDCDKGAIRVKAKEDERIEKNPEGQAGGFEANSSSGSGCGFDSHSSNKGFGLDEEDLNDGSWKDMEKGFDEESECLEEKLDGTSSLKEKKKGGFSLSPSASLNSWLDESIFSTTKRIPHKKFQGKSTTKSKSGSFSYGCFLCSPKTKKKSKKNRVKEMGLSYGWNMNMDGDDDDGFLSDLGVFSEKERDKILKKAMKEEEKISREAEKIVQMAKQASARMNVSYGIKDELTDDDDV